MKSNKERIEDLESIVTQLHINQKILINNLEVIKNSLMEFCGKYS